jgi:hypothetical protein
VRGNSICYFHLIEKSEWKGENKRTREREKKNNIDELTDITTTAMNVEKYIFFLIWSL